jgi:hypothetical protein
MGGDQGPDEPERPRVDGRLGARAWRQFLIDKPEWDALERRYT